MTQSNWLEETFQKNRGHLQKVAFRMLGSSTEADDAVQEAWIRFRRAEAEEVENFSGWLTTIVARVCLDMLRSRRAHEETAQKAGRELPGASSSASDPEADLLLADSVGPALLVMLESLSPAERVAYVLHDMFDMPFEEIAPIIDRAPAASRQLASRARRRIKGEEPREDPELPRHRDIVHAFLAASRDGDFEALLSLLDPEVVLRSDKQAVLMAAANNWGGHPDLPNQAHGPRAVFNTLKGRSFGVRPALIDGEAGAAAAPAGRAFGVWLFTIDDGKIIELELLMDPARIARMHVTLEG